MPSAPAAARQRSCASSTTTASAPTSTPHRDGATATAGICPRSGPALTEGEPSGANGLDEVSLGRCDRVAAGEPGDQAHPVPAGFRPQPAGGPGGQQKAFGDL